MYEISQSQVSRAVDVLKNGPMPAEHLRREDVAWSTRQIWQSEDRREHRFASSGQAGLRRKSRQFVVSSWFFKLGFERARRVRSGLGGEIRTQLPAELPARLITALPANLSWVLEWVPRRRNGTAETPTAGGAGRSVVVGVTHDAVYGNVRVRGHFIDDCLAEACAFAVLRGRSLNVYPPLGNALVGLSPIEGGRVLHVRWRQSGAVPALPSRGWILLDDGIASAPGSWRPAGANLQWPEEPFLERIARQRAEAGLGPAVQR